MIFVILGTQDKPFNRLLDAVAKQIDNGNIKEEVIVQAGCTIYKHNKMKVYDLLSNTDFEKYNSKCDVVITHGGVGSILTSLSHNKKVIAAARLSKYKEHTNDHQLQIINSFVKEGYILKLDNMEKLDEVLLKIKNFKPKKYVSNTHNFCEKLYKEIEKL